MPPDPTPQPAPELRFGNFEILRTERGRLEALGSGSFGRTYKARHRYLDTLAALKVINQRHAADPAVRRRFFDEARAVSRLQHAHIARLHDFGETEGVLYYAMEFCGGGDLDARVKARGPAPAAEVLRIAWQLASALECAHRQGFIHRDLKPSNVMLVEPAGEPCAKLIDFGLVQSVKEGAEAAEEVEQRFIGTPLYASPEQLREEPLDARTDLFSLGMTLWHLLAGTAPETGSPGEITGSRLDARGYAERLPVSAPGELRVLVARLVEKKPAARFDSASALLAAIAECARELGVPLDAAQPSAPAAAPAPAEREAGIVRSRAPLGSEYEIGRRASSDAAGATYLAKPRRGNAGEVWLHVLRRGLAADDALLGQICENCARLGALDLPALLRPILIHACLDETAVVFPTAGTVTLADDLRRRGVVRLADAQHLLEALAETYDRVRAEDLPGLDLAADRVFLRWPDATTDPQPLATAAPSAFPRLLPAADLADGESGHAGMTMTTDMLAGGAGGDASCVGFASLLYRVAAGRSCPAAASLSIQGFVAAPALSESSNRLLALAIAGQSAYTSCNHVLRDILSAEGLRGGSNLDAIWTSATGARTATMTRSGTLPAPAPPVIPAPSALPVSKAKPKRSLLLPTIVVGLVLIAAVLGLVIFTGSKTELATAEMPATKVSSLPAEASITLDGFFPEHARFSVNGKPVTTTGTSERKVVPLGGEPLPATIKVSAQAFEPASATVSTAAELKAGKSLSMRRSHGTVVFTRAGASDYVSADFKMLEVLPEDRGVVELARFPFGGAITATPQEFELATGVYRLTVKGDNNRTVAPRVLGTQTISAGGKVEIALPPSFAGRYTGDLCAATGPPAACELIIDPGFATGSFLERASGATRRVPLVNGRINANGVFTARVQFSRGRDAAARYDELLTLTPADGSFPASLVEAPDDDSVTENELGRKPSPPGEYQRTGTLQRTGD